MPYSTILAFLVFGLSQTACASTDVSEIIKSNFEPLISDSLPIQERRQSITVAIVTPKETEMFFLGELSDAGGKPNELTVFEIGSLTKGYLGLLIAKASIDGKIELDGPISDKFQPLKSKMQPITWRQLANQTSGFPRLPSNLNAVDPLQPYRDYDLPDMLSYLSKYNSTAEPGKTHDYSNFGAGVAGAALSELYGKPLNEIFTEMIAKPNHLTDTTIFLEDHQQQRQAPAILISPRRCCLEVYYK